MKKVLVLHTGGTFGMVLPEKGGTKLQPSKFLKDLFTYVPELSELAQLKVEVLCNVDSSDVGPAEWSLIANSLVKNYNSFDGFVVIHGTDTMAYSATAVSFFLSQFKKPVVFTGSQRPLAQLRNDARANIVDSVELATMGMPEVMICFHSQVHLATRASKFSNEHLLAFRSINSEPIGSFGVKYSGLKNISKSIKGKPSIDTRINSKIMSIDCLPGVRLSDEIIDGLLKTCNGIVIRGFGAGNLPICTSWKRLCAQALSLKVPVVMGSQCASGKVELEAYENGRIFKKLGVISSNDMTLESMTLKLMIMLGREVPFIKRQSFFNAPLAGECAP